MNNRTRQLVLALFLGSCLLLPPANAFAAGTKKPAPGCVSAICVYREQQPTPTGNQVLGQGSGKPTPLSSRASQALAQYKGADKQTIKTLATSPAYSIGPSASSPSSPSSSSHRVASGPTGSAAHPAGTFDLGPGGTWLFYLLAISAGLVVIAAGVRLFRR